MAKASITEMQFTDFEELADSYNCSASPDYSGRGMYGATCLSVSGNDGSLHELMFAIARESELAEMLKAAPSHDSMGLGSVWYWRHIQVDGYESDGRF